jgi:hypothetical protein
MSRENFVVKEEVSAMFTELASAMQMNKTEFFVKLVTDEYKRRSELLELFRKQQEIEKKANALRNAELD